MGQLQRPRFLLLAGQGRHPQATQNQAITKKRLQRCASVLCSADRPHKFIRRRVRMHSNFDRQIREIATETTAMLDVLLAPVAGPRGRVLEAMRYSALDGGKRFRPFLVVAGADLLGGVRLGALRTAAALEMVHCYSLIHDDLPAMDNADLRRGRPSLHKAFNEAVAILAGDGLLTFAFEVLADAATHADGDVRLRLILELAKAAGCEGMVGGQMIDLSQERDGLDLAGVANLQALKTGALIRYAARAGAILGRASPAQEAALDAYASDVGLVFQIADDLLDVTATTEALGKPAGQDESNAKATFVKLLGLQGAQAEAARITERAIAHLDGFGPRADVLREAARFVLVRES